LAAKTTDGAGAAGTVVVVTTVVVAAVVGAAVVGAAVVGAAVVGAAVVGAAVVGAAVVGAAVVGAAVVGAAVVGAAVVGAAVVGAAVVGVGAGGGVVANAVSEVVHGDAHQTEQDPTATKSAELRTVAIVNPARIATSHQASPIITTAPPLWTTKRTH
jgi:hypothetical protein